MTGSLRMGDTMKPWTLTLLIAATCGSPWLAGCSLLVEDAIRDPADGGMDAGETDVCSEFPDGTRCSVEGIAEDFVCVAGQCELSACGDGVLDDRSEQCDDGNDAAGDGCEPVSCDYTCDANDDCDDGLVCTGQETCGPAHFCVAGTPLAEGTCEDGGMCVGGTCIPAGCNNGVLDSGEECDPMITTDGSCQADCTWVCDTDADCALTDTDVCDGISTCDLGTHLCVGGTPLDCPDVDSNPCTIDRCDPARGCVVDATTNDADMDGHYATSCGGDDCDDTSDLIYTGRGEICGDGLDNDCSGTADDNTPVWYVDCDGDGFAPGSSGAMTSCTMPTAAPSSCPAGTLGRWTSRVPTTSATDCHDLNGVVRPSQTGFFANAYTRPNGTTSFDYDCDGVLEPHYPYYPTRPGTCSGTRTECDGPRYFPEAARCGQSSTFSGCVWLFTIPTGCFRQESTATETVRCH